MSIDIWEHPFHSHSLHVPHSFDDWQSMKKEVSYKLNLDLYQKLESKELFIEKFISNYQKELLEVNRKPGVLHHGLTKHPTPPLNRLLFQKQRPLLLKTYESSTRMNAKMSKSKLFLVVAFLPNGCNATIPSNWYSSISRTNNWGKIKSSGKR